MEIWRGMNKGISKFEVWSSHEMRMEFIRKALLTKPTTFVDLTHNFLL